MKFKLFALIAILSVGCVSQPTIDPNDFKKTQDDVQKISTNLDTISKSQNDLSKTLIDTNTHLTNLDTYINNFKNYINNEITNLKSISDNLDSAGNTLAIDSTDIGASVVTIKTESSKITSSLVTIQDSNEKTNINNSNNIIAQQAEQINKLNEQNKAAELLVAEADKRVKEATARAEAEKEAAVKAQQESTLAKSDAAQAQGQIVVMQKQTEEAKATVIVATKDAKKNASDLDLLNKSIKELQDKNQAVIQDILIVVICLGIALIAAGIAGAVTGGIPLKLGIAGAICGGILFSVGTCLLRFLQEFEIAGLVLICVVFLALLVYGIYILITHVRANAELVELNNHTQSLVPDESKSAVVTATNLVTSNSTKTIMNSIQNDLNKVNPTSPVIPLTK